MSAHGVSGLLGHGALMNPAFRQLIRSLSNLATEVAIRLEREWTGGRSELEAARISLQEALCRDVPSAECADMLSQAMVCSLPLVLWQREAFEVAGPWLLESATAWQRLTLEEVSSS